MWCCWFLERNKKEMDYLKSAFESYKTQLTFETDARWAEKMEAVEIKNEAELRDRIKEMGECALRMRRTTKIFISFSIQL